jgi:ubiquinone/menaquinone biosynthesis C-methylase UbiE
VWLFSLLNRNPKSNVAAVERLALGSEDRFLDLGCGLGAALEHATFTGAAVYGLDPSPAMVARAQERVPGAEVREGSAEAIPFPDQAFTVALSVATFHHWADQEAGLAEVRRVLAPGGRLMIVEGLLKRASGHGLDRGGAEGLAKRLAGLGFEGPEVDTMRVGRHDYLVVTSGEPGSVGARID